MNGSLQCASQIGLAAGARGGAGPDRRGGTWDCQVLVGCPPAAVRGPVGRPPGVVLTPTTTIRPLSPQHLRIRHTNLTRRDAGKVHNEITRGRTDKRGQRLPDLTKTDKTTRRQHGDARFLLVVNDCIERRAKILGMLKLKVELPAWTGVNLTPEQVERGHQL